MYECLNEADLTSPPCLLPLRGEGERGGRERERGEGERERGEGERRGREERERERERRAVKPSSPCRHNKNTHSLDFNGVMNKVSHFRTSNKKAFILASSCIELKKLFSRGYIRFSCPKVIFSKVKPTSSTSRSCWKRELGRHRPMDIFSDSRSPGLTPSLRDDRSKVVSMAVTLAGSGNYKDYRKTSEKDKDTWFYVPFENGRLALLHP